MGTTESELIAKWQEAVTLFTQQDYAGSLRGFKGIAEESHTAKTLFSQAVVCRAQGDSEAAVQALERVIERDPHMAVGYYLMGIVCLESKGGRGGRNRGQEAAAYFEKASQQFKVRNEVSYAQLGMRFKLHKAHCEHNCAYALYKTNQRDAALSWVETAQYTASTDANFKQGLEISALLAAISANKKSNKLLYINMPPELMFAPARRKVDNLGKKHYMRDAKIVGKLARETSALTFEGNEQFKDGKAKVNKIEHATHVAITNYPGDHNYMALTIGDKLRVEPSSQGDRGMLYGTNNDSGQTGNINRECVKEIVEVKKANLVEIKKPKELIEQEKHNKGIHLPFLGKKSGDNKHIEITRVDIPAEPIRDGEVPAGSHPAHLGSGRPAPPSPISPGRPAAPPIASGRPAAPAGPKAPPFGRPTAGPKAPPSGRPVAAPKAPPSGRPVAGPKAPPSGRPVAAPKAPPSGRPVAAPKAPPSGRPVAAPKAPPSGRPVSGPKAPPSGRPASGPKAPPGRPYAGPKAPPTTKRPTPAPVNVKTPKKPPTKSGGIKFGFNQKPPAPAQDDFDDEFDPVYDDIDEFDEQPEYANNVDEYGEEEDDQMYANNDADLAPDIPQPKLPPRIPQKPKFGFRN